MDIDENEENSQKQNCAPLPLFWGTVYPRLNLTEPMDIDENEENGQKQNCAPLPLFWGIVPRWANQRSP